MNKPAQYPKSVLKLKMQIIKEMKAEENTDYTKNETLPRFQ